MTESEQLLDALSRNDSRLNVSEDLCRQCGLCCREKVIDAHNVIRFLPSRCEWLRSDNKCQVYAERFSRNRSCVTARVALLMGILPFQCAYVQENWHLIKGWYKPPILSPNVK